MILFNLLRAPYFIYTAHTRNSAGGFTDPLKCLVRLGHYKQFSTKFRGLITIIPSYPENFNRCLSPLIIILHLPATAHSRNLSSSGSPHTDISSPWVSMNFPWIVTNSIIGNISISWNLDESSSETRWYSSSICCESTI